MKVALLWLGEDYRAYGVRILSSCLKRDGHDVRLVFAGKGFEPSFSDTEVAGLVRALDGSQLVGVSLTTMHFSRARQVTEAIKSALGVPVIWGGIHPTISPAECLEHADLVCVGEGEVALCALANRLGVADCGEIAGIWHKGRTGVVDAGPAPLVRDLDSLPFPDYESETHLHLRNGLVGPLKDEEVIEAMYETFTTRGCTGWCAYCCNNMFKGMYERQWVVRKRSARNVIEELVGARKRLPFLKEVSFGDDAFFSRNSEEMQDFSKEYASRVGLPFRVYGLIPGAVSKEKLKPLVDAGLYFVRMGIQTGSERTRRLYERRHTNEQIENAASVIHGFRKRISNVYYDIIVDNPWEGPEDLEATLLLLSRLPRPFKLNVFSLVLYPGTKLHEMAVSGDIRPEVLAACYQKPIRRASDDSLQWRVFNSISSFTEKGERIPVGKLRSLLRTIPPSSGA